MQTGGYAGFRRTPGGSEKDRFRQRGLRTATAGGREEDNTRNTRFRGVARDCGQFFLLKREPLGKKDKKRTRGQEKDKRTREGREKDKRRIRRGGKEEDETTTRGGQDKRRTREGQPGHRVQGTARQCGGFFRRENPNSKLFGEISLQKMIPKYHENVAMYSTKQT